MGDMIYQLTFVATRRADFEVPSATESLSRLAESARGFGALKLTGLLLYRGNRLLYHMEGVERDVMAQHDKIKADTRVEGVVILRQKPSPNRMFHIWNFALEDDPRDTRGGTLTDRVATLLANTPAEVAQTFLAFAKLPSGKAA